MSNHIPVPYFVTPDAEQELARRARVLEDQARPPPPSHIPRPPPEPEVVVTNFDSGRIRILERDEPVPANFMNWHYVPHGYTEGTLPDRWRMNWHSNDYDPFYGRHRMPLLDAGFDSDPNAPISPRRPVPKRRGEHKRNTGPRKRRPPSHWPLNPPIEATAPMAVSPVDTVPMDVTPIESHPGTVDWRMIPRDNNIDLEMQPTVASRAYSHRRHFNYFRRTRPDNFVSIWLLTPDRSSRMGPFIRWTRRKGRLARDLLPLIPARYFATNNLATQQRSRPRRRRLGPLFLPDNGLNDIQSYRGGHYKRRRFRQ